jgi:general secretion pathway protein G
MTGRIQNGFTLVELLSIVLIMAILMGITIPVMRSAYSRAKVAKAKSDIAKLETAAEQYKNDYGSYPDSSDSKNLFRAASSISPVTKKPYIIFKSKDIKNEQLIDSWGTPYAYTTPGTQNTNSVDIYSFGPNKADDAGTGDDINNWSR